MTTVKRKGAIMIVASATLSVPFADEEFNTPRQVLDVEMPASEGETAACPVRPLRVLLVDDNRYVAELMAMLLRSDGHDVYVACDGLAALESAQTHRPEVVLLDLQLPVMNGYEVARRLRAGEDTKHIFLAAVTGHPQDDDRDPRHEADFDCYLVKPVEPDVLRMLVASAAKRAT
jgi:two-component system CheB/CheR fusion protein